MTDFGDKDTIRLRIGEQNLDSSIVVEESETKKPKPWGSSSRWNIIFLFSCVIGVLMDPLFIYIPFINEDDKCLGRDEKMKIVALFFRSITDLAYILDMAIRVGSASKMAKKTHSSIWTRLPWSYLLIDILAILPFPQVLFHFYFRTVAWAGSKSTRKFLNFFLLVQYVPRTLRIYLSAKDLERTFDLLILRLSAKDLGRTFNLLILRLWVGGLFNIFLYIMAGHVFGAHWYFQSILSMTNCWNKACEGSKNGECKTDDASFYCAKLGKNSTETKDKIKVEYLKAECAVNPRNIQEYFGIFAEAIESHVLGTNDFPKKFTKCFWWGLRNLSSMGQNLVTSGRIEENGFALLISILGLLLFLYFIGNVQTYMQFATTKKLETDRSKELDEWISDNGIPNNKKKEIMQHMRWRLQEGKDVDVVNILGALPDSLVQFVREHLCLDTLNKVPMIKTKYGLQYERIYKYLKPVTYSENTYIIRKEEPLDMILFITQGIVWSFNETSMQHLQKGDYFGNELLEWELENSKSFSTIPRSPKNVKAHTKVEAFALKAADLEQAFKD